MYLILAGEAHYNMNNIIKCTETTTSCVMVYKERTTYTTNGYKGIWNMYVPHIPVHRKQAALPANKNPLLSVY